MQANLHVTNTSNTQWQEYKLVNKGFKKKLSYIAIFVFTISLVCERGYSAYIKRDSFSSYFQNIISYYQVKVKTYRLVQIKQHLWWQRAALYSVFPFSSFSYTVKKREEKGYVWWKFTYARLPFMNFC